MRTDYDLLSLSDNTRVNVSVHKFREILL